MRVVIAGAGSVGRSIARELLAQRPPGAAHRQQPRRHQDPQRARRASGCWPTPARSPRSPRPSWPTATSWSRATGDDKANLVVSLLAKTEYGVPRTVARVNNPKNEWMFDEAWGVDVAVSTPRLMTALVEEAVSVGDLVRIFTFQQGHATMVELPCREDSPAGRHRGRRRRPGRRTPCWSRSCAANARSRPPGTTRSRPDDELLFITVPEPRTALQALLGTA